MQKTPKTKTSYLDLVVFLLQFVKRLDQPGKEMFYFQYQRYDIRVVLLALVQHIPPSFIGFHLGSNFLTECTGVISLGNFLLWRQSRGCPLSTMGLILFTEGENVRQACQVITGNPHGALLVQRFSYN